MRNIRNWKMSRWFPAIFLIVNLIAVLLLVERENYFINSSLSAHAQNYKNKTEEVMQNYTHSFRLFANILSREIENNPEPDDIWDSLKELDSQMFAIEGDTFDGLYMYYKERYLYSWDTPFSEYESTGYVATERPWYKDAVEGDGKIVFTPPYMSYANHYILSTISQLQPDGKTVFAYDIKMGDIQKLVASLQDYSSEEMMIFDNNGTIIGSTDTDYLGKSLSASISETQNSLVKAQVSLEQASDAADEQRAKLLEQVDSTNAFLTFRKRFDYGLSVLTNQPEKATYVKVGNKPYYGYLLCSDQYNFLILVPFWSMLMDSVQIWLLPLLALDLLLIYILDRISKGQKNRELEAAYIELGQTQKRLELALSAAQKAAAIDDLTGMMNIKSFRKKVTDFLETMAPDESSILIMMDGDHFKTVNDNYGHTMGDEVIKLCAQMIIGRIRTVDLASRLHGDEFSIFVAGTSDYSVAKKIIDDINSTLASEAAKRHMPGITMSAGAVVARSGDTYTALAKAADAALYKAKPTHNGGFASASVH